MTLTTGSFLDTCDDYLNARTGKYEWRSVRYKAAGDYMTTHGGLNHNDTLIDVGAGFTELDYCLRVDYAWRGRYIPVDGSIDGTDLRDWTPPREAAWLIGLEIIEHLHEWPTLVRNMQAAATKGVILSTPNPATTDVLGMDATHVCEVFPCQLEAFGFAVRPASFYGAPDDSLFATWRAQPNR